MPTIDDFVNHRWADAREALRMQDPEYIRKVEDLVREDASRSHLIVLSPEAMPPFEVDVTPRKPLSKEWHKLFEACNETTRQADIVRTVAACLTADQLRQAPKNIAGCLFVYHFRSFAIHVKTLGEWANKLIKKTVETYIKDPKSRKKIYQRHRKGISEKMPKHLDSIRNSNVHATDDNWSRAVTAEQNWEPAVALGQTPRIAYNVLFYPLQGDKFKNGEYAHFIGEAEIILNDIGNILHDFEQDLKASYKLKYPMG